MGSVNSKPLRRYAKHRECVGYRASPEYQCWQRMKKRCYNANCKDYYLYGARGITVCTRWLTSFSNFLADMGRRPSPKHSIDRIDSSIGYSPENCRWATPLEQGQNTSRVKLLTYNGETHCVAEWARRLGRRRMTLIMRLRRGWSIERTLTTPT